MKIDCELKPNKNNDGYYLYIPLIEKYVFLEKIEQKYIQVMLDMKKEVTKPVEK